MKAKNLFLLLCLTLLIFAAGCKKDNATPGFTVADLPTDGDPDAGERLYERGDGSAAACISCHRLEGGDSGAGPSLAGFANRASERVDGEDAREYALNSIIAPGKYIVNGFSNTMPSNYQGDLSKQQIADVIAFLLTLD